MSKWKIPMYKVLVDDYDVIYSSRVIKRGMSWAIGPEIEEFESRLAKYVGTEYCIAFNSGTSAQHAALLALGIKQQHRVIVPSFTFISTANSVLMVNAKPVFADIEEESYGLDPVSVEKSITTNTKAIMPIHYAGGACKIDEIYDIAKRRHIPLIEDAAESLGAKTGKRMVGSYGEMAVFSFAGNKVLTTGEGGAIVTNSKKLYDKLKLIRSHGRQETENYFQSNLKPDYISVGYNWRMSSITAALGLSQFKKLGKMISMRQKNAKYLSSKLRDMGIAVPQENTFEHVYQLYSVRLKSKRLRDGLMNYLTKNGIMSKIYFEPVHKALLYRKLGYSKQKLPVTNKVSEQILSLPMYPTMKQSDLNLIVDTVGKFMKRN
ncbi:MAG: DegT/DnrJ/EryC1/StrS family aminotransferase [Nitrosarchaeum sp.]|nr:DegT/DnrJ/EryC1/StrS family aminotransferase [Nitrosarchaeum sp.]MCA9819714.1 DegT/DnrJ/EryC1/StrS family aminotransferase [Nitrosarchaeum sp.]